eukprot:1196353-Prorocentrum_minimum.AAC.4
MFRFLWRPNAMLRQKVEDAKAAIQWRHPIISMHVRVGALRRLLCSNDVHLDSLEGNLDALGGSLYLFGAEALRGDQSQGSQWVYTCVGTNHVRESVLRPVCGVFVRSNRPHAGFAPYGTLAHRRSARGCSQTAP